jgi:hypothetical protein
VALSWALSAFVFVPAAWRRQVLSHPALENVPRVTSTRLGIPGDPLNFAIIGTKEEVCNLFLKAGWRPADPVTFRTSLRMAHATLLGRPYKTAPMSELRLWGRKQDLAFQYPVGKNPRKRHHCRFWCSEDKDEDGRPLWVGAATYDRSAGIDRNTLKPTHHNDADVDAERDKLLADLKATGLVAEPVVWADDFHEQLTGRNGGGDPYHTDGRLPVVVIARASEE